VGRVLARLLADEGAIVYGLRRSETELPPGVTPVRADLTDRHSLGDLPSGIESVVYAASPDGRSDEAYRAAYVEGPATLLDALDRVPRRFVLVGSTAVYGVRDGSVVTEETRPDPVDFRGARILEGEAIVAGRVEGAVALRLGGIYGPGRTRLVDRVRRGEARCPDEGPRYTNRIHRDDAARAARHLLRLDDPAEVYLGVDREPADLCDVLRWIAERTGSPDPARDLPDGVDESGESDTGRRRGHGKRCSSDRLRASGFGFRYPTFREGYAALLA
ncbi:MAG: NAD-dependent epimerase/dehydratase family protein, partial [Gemmatimonadota bacterium]|nr:NAD-dependent epimerase/dehydratase family protein [Gemmatimonadota bacterium]